MALSDNGQSTRKLIFSRGDFFLKPGATLQIKLHSYRVKGVAGYNQEKEFT